MAFSGNIFIKVFYFRGFSDTKCSFFGTNMLGMGPRDSDVQTEKQNLVIVVSLQYQKIKIHKIYC